jgi:hypothetical protein
MTRLRLAIGLPALALVLLWVGVRLWFEVRPAAPLPAATRTTVVHALRASLEGADPPRLEGAGLDRPSRGPAWVSLIHAGALVVQRECRGPTVGAALATCAAEVAAAVRGLGWSAAERAAVRIKVDVTTAEGPVPAWPKVALAFGVVPGVDGLGVRLDGREARLLPDELLRDDLLNGQRLFERYGEIRTGLHVSRAVTVLARRLEVDGATWSRASKRFFRLRTDSFVEAAPPSSGPPREVVRGAAPGEPRLDAAGARAAARSAAAYLVRHQRPDGSFNYVYETVHDAALTSEYSGPRHFGVTSFLGEAYGAERDPAVATAVRRALAWGEARINAGCSDARVACVAPSVATVADVGSTALALIAITQYRRHVEDRRLDPLAHRLAEFLLRMQRPDGSFMHHYRLAERRPDPRPRLAYYDGEATLALVAVYRLSHDPRHLDAARRGLDWLTKEQYRHFAGRFYFGEDHWTCIAAGAAWPDLRDPVYEQFCRDYAAFVRRQQFGPGEQPADLRGAYGFSPFILPHTTPTGSRTEAMISAYLLGRHHGRPDERIRGQVREALRYLLQQQLQPDSCYLCGDPERAAGGFLESPAARHVRMDFVQHSGSALLRGAELL